MNQHDNEKLMQGLKRSRDSYTRSHQRQHGKRMTERDREIIEAARNRP